MKALTTKKDRATLIYSGCAGIIPSRGGRHANDNDEASGASQTREGKQ